MSNIRIVADSTCDLPKDLLEKYNISIIPLCIVMGDESYYDGIETTPDEIYAWADENKTTPKTAAISMDKAEDVFKPFMEAGDDIIFFGISSEMSTTCNVARIVGEDNDYDKLHIIDSRSLSTGIGLQVLRAAEMVEAGMNAEDIVEEINEARGKVSASFVVDTLTYLARGGRCTAATALVANTLKLHPEIVVRDGKMGVNKKYRGSLDSALLKYAKELQMDMLQADPKRVFITHSGCSQETIDKVYQFVKEMEYFEEIIIARSLSQEQAV